MPQRLLHPDEYELVDRVSSDTNETFDLDEADFESQGLTTASYVHQRPSFTALLRYLPPRLRNTFIRLTLRQRRAKRPASRHLFSIKALQRRICFFPCITLTILSALVFLTAIFRPSYTILPKHYQTLKAQILDTRDEGRGNLENQKIFIATSIYDRNGRLAGGAWGQAILNLIDILGNDNVYLSIYENDGGDEAQGALRRFETELRCQHSLIFEKHLPLDNISHVTLPDGSKRIKRIAYLAEARNRALRPLSEASAPIYDKVLYLNDVVFDPVDAAQLLFSTHLNEQGHADYFAACAVDFMNPFKYFDTFATRDIEGFSMGVPFFPWFSSAGKAISRQDVLDGKDAVRVKSCWGGMVAFDAKFFQAQTHSENAKEEGSEGAGIQLSSRSNSTWTPLRFRSEPDIYWDASECCLIHADIQGVTSSHSSQDDVGIYQNPFVRVAYDSRTLWWLGFTRRFERLYSWPHFLINSLVGLPWYNPRREEPRGVEISETIWISNSGLKAGGSLQEVSRLASGGGFCGIRTLQLIKETARDGERNWETIKLPLPSA